VVVAWRPLTPNTILSPDSILGPLGWWSAEGDVIEGEGVPLSAEGYLPLLSTEGALVTLVADDEV